MLYFLSRPPGHYRPLALILTLIGIAFSLVLQAQTADGNTGLNQANTMVRSYYEPATNLMYAVAAVLGLIGAIKVFRSMMESDRSGAGQQIAIWGGACVFLVVVTAVIKAFFGI